MAGNLHHGSNTPMVPVGMAGKDLALAARHCQSCSQNRGYLQAVWKLMGDVHLQYHSTTPPADAQLYTMHQVPNSTTVQSHWSPSIVQTMELLSHASNICSA